MKRYIFFLLLLAGCSQSVESEGVYVNEFHGFSLNYPDSWNSVEGDEPDRWAIVDGADNAMLVIVENATSSDLVQLGIRQAVLDHLPNKILPSELQESVRRISSGDREWYTYGLFFGERNIQSVVSGTLCKNKEVKVILVAHDLVYDAYRGLYLEMLDSFQC